MFSDPDFQEKLSTFKIPIALSLLGVVLILGGVIFSSSAQPKKDLPAGRQGFPKESLVTTKEIQVDVSGAVKNPGVYKLSEGSRVEEAITKAGGLSDQVNQEYVSKYLNLAQKLSDGSKIYLPFEGEQVPKITGQAGVVSGVSSSSQVNINTSTQAELEALPGIGPVTASKIISGRPYQKIEDLTNQKIVSKSVYEKIKDSISLY